MQEIDWSHRLIGIKGSRGVGKTTFLLQYAKENFGIDRSCLYINLNHLYFTERTLVDFADEFRVKGGKDIVDRSGIQVSRLVRGIEVLL